MSPDGLTIGIEKTNVDMKPCTSMRRLLEIARTGEIPTLTQSSPPTIFLAILAAANDHSRDPLARESFADLLKHSIPLQCFRRQIRDQRFTALLSKHILPDSMSPKYCFNLRYGEDEDEDE